MDQLKDDQDFDPLRMGDVPDGMTENPDGSIEVEDLEDPIPAEHLFRDDSL